MSVQDTHESLGKMIGLSTDVVRAAAFEPAQLTALHDRAVRGARREKRLTIPLAFLAGGLVGGIMVSQTVTDDRNVSYVFGMAALPVLLGFAALRAADPRQELRHTVEQAAARRLKAAAGAAPAP